MRTSIDLPDPLFRELKLKAAKRGVSLKAIIQEAVVRELQEDIKPKSKLKYPLIPVNGRQPYNLTSAEIEDLLT